MSGINQQSEVSEIFIKGETWHPFEQVCNKHIRNGVTKGEFFISGKFFEDILSGNPYGIIVSDYKKCGLDGIKEFNGHLMVRPISEKGYCFAYNIPCGTECYGIILTIFKDFTCFFKICVVRT